MQRSLRLVLMMLSICLAGAVALAEVTVTEDVNPADATTWNSSTDVTVGDTATGEVTVDGGSLVETYDTTLGDQAGSAGTVTLGGSNGSGSWTTNGSLTVGRAGTGTFNVSSGGILSVAGLDIGENGALNLNGGTLELTDSMELFNWQGSFNLLWDSQSELRISNGTITAAAPLSISNSNRLRVTGNNSTYSGTFNELALYGRLPQNTAATRCNLKIVQSLTL